MEIYPLNILKWSHLPYRTISYRKNLGNKYSCLIHSFLTIIFVQSGIERVVKKYLFGVARKNGRTKHEINDLDNLSLILVHLKS